MEHGYFSMVPKSIRSCWCSTATTWSELEAAVKALTKDGMYGIGLPGNKQLYTDQTIYSFMVNSGASEIYNSDGSLRFDNEGTVKAYDVIKTLSVFCA